VMLIARRKDQSRYPEHWDQLVGGWNPGAGPSGKRLYDLSGCDNHGTLINATPSDWEVSQGQYALDIEGANKYVSIPGALRKIGGLTRFSIGGWFSVDSFANFPVLMTFRNGFVGSDCGLLETNDTGSVMYVKVASNLAGLSGVRTYTLDTAMVTGRWYHCIMSKTGSGDSLDFFFDGRLQTSFTGSVQDVPASLTDALFLGAYVGGNVGLDGRLDDWQLRTKSTTIADARSLHRIGRGGIYQPKRRVFYSIPASVKAWLFRRQSQIIGGGLG